MKLTKFAFILFFETPGDLSGAPSGGRTSEQMGPEDDLKFLRENSSKEENEEEPSVEEEEAPEGEEEVQEEENPEEENEEEKNEEDENETEEEKEENEKLEGLVTAKDLKAKYPDIFKKVPELRGIIYREQQYAQLFADPKEAQTVVTQADAFTAMENDLSSGNSLPLFEALKKSEGADFNKLAANILPSLKKVDEATYMKVLAVPFKMLLRSAASTGAKSGNKNLELSAQHLHHFIFEDTDLSGKAEFEGNLEKKSESEDKFEKKLAELDARDHRNFKVSVDGEFINGIRDEFYKGLEASGLSKWTKDKMFEEAIKELGDQLSSDRRHMKELEGYWKQAKASGYGSDSKTRIVNTSLARAKQILPNIRIKLKKEALAKGEVHEEGKKKVVKIKPSNERREERPRVKDSRKTDEMSDLDIIRSAK